MAKRAAGLTARQVETAKKPGLMADGNGLYLQIVPTGAKTWIFRFQIRGRRRDMGLGSADIYTLAEARRRHAEARKLVAEGLDPIEQRRSQAVAAAAAAAKTKTFDECARAYIVGHQAVWRNPITGRNWRNSLATHVSPVFGAQPVQAVDDWLVLQVLEPLWTSRPVLASSLRSQIEVIIDWAKVSGHRNGANPARWRGHLDKRLPKISKFHRIKHHPAMPYGEIAAFVTKLRGHRRPRYVGPFALEFIILTALRPNEVAFARWDEINLADKIWTIPAERMKMEREHRVPLSAPAMAILDAMMKKRQSDCVFPGLKGAPSICITTMNALLRRMDPTATPHGFRSAFRSWAGDNGVQDSVAEMALAHVAGPVVRAYQRSDLFEQRRRVMEAWAQYCTAPLIEKVVPLRRAAR